MLLPRHAILQHDVPTVYVTARGEASVLQKQKSFQDLPAKSLHLLERQTRGPLLVLLSPVFLPVTLKKNGMEFGPKNKTSELKDKSK